MKFIGVLTPGRGIGKKLMDHLIEFAKTNNIQKIISTVSTKDKRAMGFYNSFNFKKFDEDNINSNFIINKIKLIVS